MNVSLRKNLHRNATVVLMWLQKLIWIYFHGVWVTDVSCSPSACSTGTMWEVALPCTMTSPTRWANWVTARTSPDTSNAHIHENQCETVTTWSYASHLNRLIECHKSDEMVSECIHGALKSFLIMDLYRYIITCITWIYIGISFKLGILSGEQWWGVTKVFSSVKAAQQSVLRNFPTGSGVVWQITTSQMCHNVLHSFTSKQARQNVLFCLKYCWESCSCQSWFREFVSVIIIILLANAFFALVYFNCIIFLIA